MAGPVPAMTIRRAALLSIGITGTRLVMTPEGTRAEGPRAERRTPIRDRENQPGTVIPVKAGIQNHDGTPACPDSGSGFPPPRD